MGNAIKVSAFCLTTNATKFGYPFIESIKSWANAVDELVVVDGGSTDGTIEMIEAIGDSKIRIICNSKTKWEDNWSYSRMGKNFNIGFNACKGHSVVKFDVDYVLHESAYEDDEYYGLRGSCARAIRYGKYILTFQRKNFMVIDRYFLKPPKSLAVINVNLLSTKYHADYGHDIQKWGIGFEPIYTTEEKNGIKHGVLMKSEAHSISSSLQVFNYSFCFSTKEQIDWIRNRHIRAEYNQAGKKFEIVKNRGFDKYKKNCWGRLRKNQIFVPFEEHPKIMQNKIKNLNPNQQGYNFFGEFIIAKYYGQGTNKI